MDIHTFYIDLSHLPRYHHQKLLYHTPIHYLHLISLETLSQSYLFQKANQMIDQG